LPISSGYPKENHAQWILKSGTNVTLFDKAKFVALIFVLRKYAM
jgi:hypothetical protein